MDSITLAGRFTLEDWRAWQDACQRRLRAERGTGPRWVRAAGIALAGALTGWLLHRLDVSLHWLSALAGAGLFATLYGLILRSYRKVAVPQEEGAFLSEHRYEFTAEGILVTQRAIRSVCSWSAIKALTIGDAHFFLWTDRYQAFVVPLRLLPEGVTRELLQERLETWTRSSLQTSAPPASAGQQPLPAPRGWGATLIKLLSLRGRHAIPESIDWRVVAMLVSIAVAVWLGVDWQRNQPRPTPYWYGLPGLAWYGLGVLGLALIVARGSRPKLSLHRALILLCAALPAVVIWSDFVGTRLSWPWDAAIALAGYLYAAVYLERGLSVMTGQVQPRLVIATILLATFFSWASELLYVSPSMWISQEDEQASADGADEEAYRQTWEEVEPLLFSQPARIDAAVARIPASSPGAHGAFFLGFAGHGDQRVFAEEIKLAAQIVGQRFDVGSRSLLLVNDRRDLQSSPLATVTALRYALGSVAQKMNREQDVLFLALSSHGSRDWSLDVSNGSMPLADLSAGELAAILKASGIKWRVIVISACYAGGFIEPLRDPYTIVVAAAAKDRTSFGCSDERELTYFGEAFYRDALPQAGSLRDAFNRARDSIAKRETEGGVTPSRPEAYFGEQLEHRLQQYVLAAAAHDRGGVDASGASQCCDSPSGLAGSTPAPPARAASRPESGTGVSQPR